MRNLLAALTALMLFATPVVAASDPPVQSAEVVFWQSISSSTDAAASSDTYIASALKKVRQSKITHPESLTRISGTWFHNQKMNTAEENK